jgi:hypothetical protein
MARQAAERAAWMVVRGARHASSGAGRATMKAFPVFKGTRGVMESNELFVHQVRVGTALSAPHKQAIAEAEMEDRAADAAAQFLQFPSETPILLEGLRCALRPTHPHLPVSGGRREVPTAKPAVGSVP